MKQTILLIGLCITLLLVVGCNEQGEYVDEADLYKMVYSEGYSEGFNFCANRHESDTIFDTLITIKFIPKSLRGCLINHYIENNQGWEVRYYEAFEDSLYYEGQQIDCEAIVNEN